ncbi:MAG TPA: type III secretion system chaperone [Beijerinckiaceae bacterium]|nr:type III secretion system chaperone [Beijerinckiaceae bacterium]
MVSYSRAGIRLAEMARDHSLARLEFDANDLITIDLEEVVVAVLLAKRRGSFFFMCRLDGAPPHPTQLLRLSQYADFGSPRRQTRIFGKEQSGEAILAAEEPGAPMPYVEFVQALQSFVSSVEQARAGAETSPVKTGQTLQSDEMHWIRS